MAYEEMQNIIADMQGDFDKMTVTMKSEDESELCVSGAVRTLIACAEKLADDYDMDFQELVDDHFGEAHIKEHRESMN